jgi:hypothetical protein
MKILLKFAIALTFLVFGFATAVSAQTGRITGKLVYPGDGIPRDLAVCVIARHADDATYCSNSKAATLRSARIIFKVDRRSRIYQVSLPPGSYLIFAKTREMSGHQAFYNEYVKCGMEYTCRSQKPITLDVRSGHTIMGIEVGDFWNVR